MAGEFVASFGDVGGDGDDEVGVDEQAAHCGSGDVLGAQPGAAAVAAGLTGDLLGEGTARLGLGGCRSGDGEAGLQLGPGSVGDGDGVDLQACSCSLLRGGESVCDVCADFGECVGGGGVESVEVDAASGGEVGVVGECNDGSCSILEVFGDAMCVDIG